MNVRPYARRDFECRMTFLYRTACAYRVIFEDIVRGPQAIIDAGFRPVAFDNKLEAGCEITATDVILAEAINDDLKMKMMAQQSGVTGIL